MPSPRKPKAKPTFFMRLLKVRGRGRFAFDMLRMDRCTPRTEKDTLAMVSDDHTEDRNVELMMFCIKEDGQPTRGRWESFGWKVIEYSGDRE